MRRRRQLLWRLRLCRLPAVPPRQLSLVCLASLASLASGVLLAPLLPRLARTQTWMLGSYWEGERVDKDLRGGCIAFGKALRELRVARSRCPHSSSRVRMCRVMHPSVHSAASTKRPARWDQGRARSGACCFACCARLLLCSGVLVLCRGGGAREGCMRGTCKTGSTSQYSMSELVMLSQRPLSGESSILSTASRDRSMQKLSNVLRSVAYTCSSRPARRHTHTHTHTHT